MFFKDKIKKLIYLVFIYFFIFNSNISAIEIIKENKKIFCNNINPDFLINQKIPYEIQIKTNNAKGWAKNIFSLYLEANSEKYKTGNRDQYNFQIPKNFKKKFKSKVKFIFKDPNYECVSDALVSIRGNLFWHIKWKKGQAFSSLRVDLLNGHLNNITSFNLLTPESRISKFGDINLEILTTTLLNELNYLAPNSTLLNVKINGKANTYLMQERLTKEFLETRDLIEGPIFKGDQRFTTEEAASMNWNGNFALAKVINSSYSVKDKQKENFSFYGLSILNNIFINNSYSGNDRFKSHRCFVEPLTINKDEYLKNELSAEINQTYEALIYATENSHSLACDDRRFYLEPIQKIFLPIYNDGKSTLNYQNTKISNNIINANVTINSIDGSKNALKLIQNINDEHFFKKLNERGFNLSIKVYKDIKNKIIKNLDALSKIDIQDKFLIKNEYFKSIDPNFLNKEVKLVFLDDKNNLEICNFDLTQCVKHLVAQHDTELKRSLLEQNFTKLKKKNKYSFNSNNRYLFLSTTKNYSNINQIRDLDLKYSKKKVNESFYFLFNEDVRFTIDEDKKKIEFDLLSPKARIKVLGKKIDSWSFSINGYLPQSTDLRLNSNIYSNRITGCLSFVDIEIKNISILSNKAYCEDAFNLIRTQGSIKSAIIQNSLSDGLDLDFSKIKISQLNISNSNNDCIDMSYGEYEISDTFLNNCGDKGISIGEKSKVSINSASIDNAIYGIVSKDSSKAFIKNSKISNIKYCLAAYRKKQEFSGSVIDFNNLSCDNYFKIFQIDEYSLIKNDNKKYSAKQM